MNEDIAHYALALASQPGAYADVRLESQEKNELVFKNGNLDLVTHVMKEGIGIRIITETGVGFSSCNILDKEHVKRTAEEAARQARSCKRKTAPQLSEEKVEKATWSVPEKKKLANVGIEEKVETLSSWEKILTSLGDIPARIFLLKDKKTKKLFLSSEGAQIQGYLPIVSCFYFLTVKENNQLEQIPGRFGYAGGWEALDVLKIDVEASREVKALQKLMREGKKSPEGKMDLVVGSDVVGIICHESCGHPTEADRILGREASQAGASFVGEGHLGTRIGSDEVTVAEDPTIEHSFGFYAYDDEGLKTRRRFLFKEGIINEFLHDRSSAAAMGVQSNGAGRAEDFNREPLVRMANTFLLPGDLSSEELIEDVASGVYMKSYTEWNIDDKRYNQKYIGRESYLIEHGEVTTMVKRPILEVTTPAFWGAVEARGKDLMFKAGNCGKGDPMQEMDVLYGGPTTRLRNIFMR